METLPPPLPMLANVAPLPSSAISFQLLYSSTRTVAGTWKELPGQLPAEWAEERGGQ